MSDEQDGEMGGETSDPLGEALRQELARNVVEPTGLPPGYQLEGPAEPGADADIPGVTGLMQIIGGFLQRHADSRSPAGQGQPAPSR